MSTPVFLILKSIINMVNIDENVKCSGAVIKIASRCNINCTYCYMYNLGDETFKLQPKIMNEETINALLNKIKLHCLVEDIKKFQFILHGGEPLLAGKDFFKNFIKKANNYLLPEITPTYHIQSNGILIDKEWCDLFKEYKVNVGISLDGVKSVNDQYRVDHKGRGTYDSVIKGIKIVQENNLGLGMLTVINIDANPVELYEHLKLLKIDNVDFLLPDYTHDNLPSGITETSYTRESTPYADWLISIFEIWFTDKDKLDIRLFKYCVCLLLGGKISFDYLGTSNNNVLVIETDGGIEPVDSLKICGDGFTKMNANVSTHEFSEALSAPLSKMYHLSKKKIHKQCTVCPLKEICGGGFLPHRYSEKNGFNNPSVYCADLIKLFTHINNRVIKEFSEEQREEFGNSGSISIKDIKNEIRESLKNVKEPTYVEELEFFKIEKAM